MKKWLCGLLAALLLLLLLAGGALAQGAQTVEGWVIVSAEGVKPEASGCYLSLEDANVAAFVRERGMPVYVPGMAPEGYEMQAGVIHLAHWGAYGEMAAAAPLAAYMQAAECWWETDGYGRVWAHFMLPLSLLEGFSRVAFSMDKTGSGEPKDNLLVNTFFAPAALSDFDAVLAARDIVKHGYFPNMQVLEDGTMGVREDLYAALRPARQEGEGKTPMRGHLVAFTPQDAALLAEVDMTKHVDEETVRGMPDVGVVVISAMDDAAMVAVLKGLRVWE